MTIIIKRYQNRKLYDTSAKRYITQEGIAELIRLGNDVQIIDNVTEEDLTNVTLMQIIMEKEKKKSGFLPLSILVSLIQVGENIWSEIGIPSQEDIENIKKQLDILEEKINSLKNKKKVGAYAPTFLVFLPGVSFWSFSSRSRPYAVELGEALV